MASTSGNLSRLSPAPLASYTYLRSDSMNRQQIDALVKQMNVDTAKGPVDERIQQVVVRLLGDLFRPSKTSTSSPLKSGKASNT